MNGAKAVFNDDNSSYKTSSNSTSAGGSSGTLTSNSDAIIHGNLTVDGVIVSSNGILGGNNAASFAPTYSASNPDNQFNTTASAGTFDLRQTSSAIPVFSFKNSANSALSTLTRTADTTALALFNPTNSVIAESAVTASSDSVVAKFGAGATSNSKHPARAYLEATGSDLDVSVPSAKRIRLQVNGTEILGLDGSSATVTGAFGVTGNTTNTGNITATGRIAVTPGSTVSAQVPIEIMSNVFAANQNGGGIRFSTKDSAGASTNSYLYCGVTQKFDSGGAMYGSLQVGRGDLGTTEGFLMLFNGGNPICSFPITVAATTSANGAVRLAGGLSISNATDSTSSSNGGSITTAGGIAAAGTVRAKAFVSDQACTFANTSSTTHATIVGDSSSSITNPFGSTTNNGQLYITGSTNTNMRLVLGYDTVNNYGIIQSIQNGTAWTPLLLNTGGGAVIVGPSGISATIHDAATGAGNPSFRYAGTEYLGYNTTLSAIVLSKTFRPVGDIVQDCGAAANRFNAVFGSQIICTRIKPDSSTLYINPDQDVDTQINYNNNGRVRFYTAGTSPALTIGGSTIDFVVPTTHAGNMLVTSATAATSNTTGALQVTGGASIQGDLYVAGTVHATFTTTTTVAATSATSGTFSDTTDSTSAATGAVTITAGGLGVKKNIYCEGSITAVSTVTAATAAIATVNISGTASFSSTTAIGNTNPSTTTGAAVNISGDLLLGSNTTRLFFPVNASRVGFPTFSTRAVGTRIILYPFVGATTVDIAQGVDNTSGAYSSWFSLPNNSGNHFWRWYGGQTNVVNLSSAGALSLAAGLTCTTMAASSNVSVGGLTTTNAIQCNSTLTVTGATSLQATTATSLTVSGASTLATATVSGTASVTGTLTAGVVNASGAVAANAGLTTTTLTASSTSTLTGNVTLGGGSTITFPISGSGVAVPSITSRSVGTRLSLFPSFNSATNAADFAVGIAANTLWFGASLISDGFAWFSAATQTATLSGLGVLTTIGGYVARSYSGSAFTGATMTLINGRGSASSPAPSQNGDEIGYISFRGTSNTNTNSSTHSAIIYTGAGTPVSGNVPGSLLISTTDSSGSSANRMVIGLDGGTTFYNGNLTLDTSNLTKSLVMDHIPRTDLKASAWLTRVTSAYTGVVASRGLITMNPSSWSTSQTFTIAAGDVNAAIPDYRAVVLNRPFYPEAVDYIYHVSITISYSSFQFGGSVRARLCRSPSDFYMPYSIAGFYIFAPSTDVVCLGTWTGLIESNVGPGVFDTILVVEQDIYIPASLGVQNLWLEFQVTDNVTPVTLKGIGGTIRIVGASRPGLST